MTVSLTYITSAFILGLSGLIPGPLLTLVISETLKHGTKEGIKVAVSPLITDLPIIVMTILVMSRIANIDYLLGMIAFGGSIFLIYLAFESISFKGITQDAVDHVSVIKKGIIANFLNPSPYVFWFTIGAPTILKAYHEGFIYAVLFLIVFYSVLIGSKVVIAVITGKSRHILSSRFYLYLIRFLGIVLFLFAIYFIKSGISYLYFSSHT
ncbi:MAG: LysE family transporter [Deltaproteobacteria bacterium]|nr:LysE family transporter [Deltaproteobacteria bacterium]